MKLLPFDLEKAKAGHKIANGNGQPAIFLDIISSEVTSLAGCFRAWMFGACWTFYTSGHALSAPVDPAFDLFLVDEFTDAQRYQLFRTVMVASPEQMKKFDEIYTDIAFEKYGISEGDIHSPTPEIVDMVFDAMLRIQQEQPS